MSETHTPSRPVRIVAADDARGAWVLYRQPQWMAHVRREPNASATAHFFDIEEDQYDDLRSRWSARPPHDLDAARALLAEHGAVEVRPC